MDQRTHQQWIKQRIKDKSKNKSMMSQRTNQWWFNQSMMNQRTNQWWIKKQFQKWWIWSRLRNVNAVQKTQVGAKTTTLLPTTRRAELGRGSADNGRRRIYNESSLTNHKKALLLPQPRLTVRGVLKLAGKLESCLLIPNWYASDRQ